MAGVAIVLMMVMIFWMDDLSWKMMLFMRGCAGVCAVIFVILVGILVFRVNSSYWRDKKDNHRTRN